MQVQPSRKRETSGNNYFCTMKDLTQKIYELEKCQESYSFCSGKSFEQMYHECPKGEWLIWAYSRLYPNDTKLITLVKGHIANTVRHLITNQACLNAIDISIAFGEGKATLKQLKAVNNAVQFITNSPDGVANHASYTIPDYAFQFTNITASAKIFYSYHSFLTAHCAANTFYNIDERTNIQKITADIVRKYIPIENIK